MGDETLELTPATAKSPWEGVGFDGREILFSPKNVGHGLVSFTRPGKIAPSFGPAFLHHLLHMAG